jgi:hypothetical protein
MSVNGGYCTPSDVAAALGRPLPLGLDVTVLIQSASDSIDAYVNTDISQDANGDYPGVVVRIAAEVVANVLNRPMPQTSMDTPDPYNAPAFQYHIGPQSLGPWLSKSQQDRLSVLRVSLRSMETHSETTGGFTRYGITDLTTSMEQDMFDIQQLGS